MNNLLYVFLGGGLGSVARYSISVMMQKSFAFVFPMATLISNALSCLILALAIGMFADKMTANPSLKLLIITGFCGGFSTFSSFSFETIDLIKQGHNTLAFANIFISIVVCFGIVYFLAKNS
jgi:CrcB protein